MSAASARGPKRGRTGTGPKSIAGALSAMFDDLGIAKTVKTYDAITSWPDVVGEQIARVAKAQRIERGILYVSVSSAPWRAELTLKRREIVKKINAAAGTTVISDIKFR